jgi:hypothetical protein
MLCTAACDPDCISAILRRKRRAFCQFPDFIRHHGKTASLFARPSRLDRRIERQQVGLVGDFLDHRDHVGDAFALNSECCNLIGRLAYRFGNPVDHIHRVANDSLAVTSLFP